MAPKIIKKALATHPQCGKDAPYTLVDRNGDGEVVDRVWICPRCGRCVDEDVYER